MYQHVPEGWKLSTLGSLTNIVAGGTPSTRVANYWNGDVLWMSSGELNLRRVITTSGRITELGLRNSSARLLPKNCVLIGLAGQGKTRGTVAINLVELSTNQSIAAILPSLFFDSEFLFFHLDSRYKELRRLSTGDGGRGALNLQLLKSINVVLPPLPEQRAIAKVLGLMDEAISNIRSTIEQKKLQKKYLMQTLLTGKKRLKGFKKSKWRTFRFRELATESIARNNGKMSNDRLMAVSKFHGLIPMRERVQGVSNSRCKTVAKDYFAYNPMRLNIGSLARWESDEPAMVSGDYVVFKCIEDRLDPDFLDFYRETNEWANYVRRAGDGSVRVRIYFSHLCPLKLKLPPLDEQKAIAKIIGLADWEISLLKTKAEFLQLQKKWLMQVLLTGKHRLQSKR